MIPDMLDDGELPVLRETEIAEVGPLEIELPGFVDPAIVVLLEIG